jgi:hypothetical protein
MNCFYPSVLSALLVLLGSGGFSQTIVTGHISAEVVESVSASQTSNSHFSISRNSGKSMDLGKIDIKSASNASCALLLSDARLTANDRSEVTFQTSVLSDRNIPVDAISGSANVNLRCQTEGEPIGDGIHSLDGEVSIILAYN